MLDFLNGRSLEDCPTLLAHVRPFRAASIEERDAEERHSHQSFTFKTAPNVSGPRISLISRYSELEQCHMTEAGFLQVLAEEVAKVYHPIRISEMLGLSSHPDIAAAISGKLRLDSTRKYDKIIKNVVYHLDGHSQYLHLPDRPAPAKSKVAAGGDDFAEMFSTFMQQAGVSLFRKVAERGYIYSIDKGDCKVPPHM